jgi:hypothetical protein
VERREGPLVRARHDDVVIVIEVALTEAGLALLRAAEDDDVLVAGQAGHEHTVDRVPNDVVDREVARHAEDVVEPVLVRHGRSFPPRSPTGPSAC